MKKVQIKTVKGFNEVLPPESFRWRQVEDKFRNLLEGYGFAELRLALLEPTELFARSIGGETDIVEKEMYTFIDRSERSLTLRPEGTASVVRAYNQYSLGKSNEINKLYYIGPMFRYERPQKGRYRQFHQLGAEVFGEESFYQDAETLVMLAQLFHTLSIKGVELHLNSLGCEACRPLFRDQLKDYLSRHQAGLCDDCRRRGAENPLRALDCKNPQCREAVAEAPSIGDALCCDCRQHFAGLCALLADAGIAFQINPRLVRGLDYYTRTTFEFLAGDLGAQNAVAAGGRYDRLVEELGGQPTPAFGFAVGFERLMMLVGSEVAPLTLPVAALLPLSEEALRRLFPLHVELNRRAQMTTLSFQHKSLKSQLKKADKDGVRYALIVGPDELAQDEALCRNMRTKEQTKLPFAEIGEFLWERYHEH
ncbi:MAG: histidine--tRNA ligase [Deltaproteobacteria bacterium]|nr:histidine--tRNA ligase [Deltaproteobacteria bacterium]